MIFRNFLDLFAPDRLVFATPEGLVRQHDLIGLAPDLLRGARIAIALHSPVNAVQALIALDGAAAAVVFISPSLDPELILSLARGANCDGILSDTPDVFLEAEGLPVAHTLDDLAKAMPPDADHPPIAEPGTQWVMTTSGTTGTPKLVLHNLTGLTKTSKLSSARGATNRWGMVYEYGRFAGLQVLLQSVLSGAVLITPDLSDPLEAQIAFLADQGCTHLSATPTLWRKIIMTRGHDRVPLEQVTMGGEIADDRILAAAKAAYPDARVAHIFASTESGVGFSVADGVAGFPEQYLTDPPEGIGLRVHDDQLYVRNSDVLAQYLNSDASFADADGWVATGDSVALKDGRVYFLGRANGVINVGGNKAHPEEIERILRDHSAVAADVVLSNPNADQEEARSTILDFAKTRLVKHEVPQLLRFVDGFDTNAAGKMIRK